MLNCFDVILAACVIAILCTFLNIPGPWMWLSLSSVLTTSTTIDASPPPKQGHNSHSMSGHEKQSNIQNLNSEDMATRVLVSVDFEVFGKVQGVFFRKFTRDTAKKHGIVGWVKNTRTGTVVGTAQGPQEKMEIMKKWLQTKGSPKSRIDRAEFKNDRSIDKTEFPEFKIIK